MKFVHDRNHFAVPKAPYCPGLDFAKSTNRHVLIRRAEVKLRRWKVQLGLDVEGLKIDKWNFKKIKGQISFKKPYLIFYLLIMDAAFWFVSLFVDFRTAFSTSTQQSAFPHDFLRHRKTRPEDRVFAMARNLQVSRKVDVTFKFSSKLGKKKSKIERALFWPLYFDGGERENEQKPSVVAP